MESFGDKFRAFVYALLVHLACVAVAFLGLLWTRVARPVSAPGPVIEAELVGAAAAPKPHAAAHRHELPKPVEPPPESPKPPEPKHEETPSEPQHNDLVERQHVAEIAQQKAEQAQRAEEERKHQEQVLLEQQQRERNEQLRKIKIEREQAEKQRKLEEEKLKQLQDLQNQKQKPVPAHPQQLAEAEQAKTGTNGKTDSLADQYGAAIINVVRQNWNRPDNAQPGLRCSVHVIQIPGGEVISANVVSPCNADQVTRTSIEQAVTKAQPLPYKGYEQVFSREITFIFTYDGN